LELVVAATFRLARDYVLAGARHAGALPDPVRRLWPPRRLPVGPSPAHGGSRCRSRRPEMGPDDARGARAVPSTVARALRLRRFGDGEQSVVAFRQAPPARVYSRDELRRSLARFL